MTITAEKTKGKQFIDLKSFELSSNPESKPKKGLCTTCTHRSVCCLTSMQPVTECEEFQREEKETETLPLKTTVTETTHARVQCEDEGFQGLCVNCEQRHACPSSSTEGGIWYCEEYC